MTQSLFDLSADRTARILAARKACRERGLSPTGIEVGPDERHSLPIDWEGMAVMVFGLRVHAAEVPGLTVLAMPNRRIGRYECVAPTRIAA